MEMNRENEQSIHGNEPEGESWITGIFGEAFEMSEEWKLEGRAEKCHSQTHLASTVEASFVIFALI